MLTIGEVSKGGGSLEKRRVTVPDVVRMKSKGRKLVMVTAYDYPIARLADQAGVDIILVGDSVGTAVLGYRTTLPVTMAEMIHHTKAVARGVERALLVGDMPFMSYQPSKRDAIRNAGRFIKAGADAVKVEGGKEVEGIVKAIIEAGIPVMGHVGFTPQKISIIGGYKVQGREALSAKVILDDAKALEEAGVFSIVLELVTGEVAKLVTEQVKVPTIGIGSGPYCDGQVLVVNDIVGLTMWEGYRPKFIKQYASVGETILNALKTYSEEVKSGKFPAEEHTRHMPSEEYQRLLELLGRAKRS